MLGIPNAGGNMLLQLFSCQKAEKRRKSVKFDTTFRKKGFQPAFWCKDQNAGQTELNINQLFGALHKKAG